MSALNWLLVSVHLVAAVLSGGHALLHKHEPSAALGWIAVCLMFPLIGPGLYFLFGINRVQTRARKLRPWSRSVRRQDRPIAPETLSLVDLHVPPEFTAHARISYAVTGRPLVIGNHVDILHNGEQAYPVMLQAIEDATRVVYLSSYIFEANQTGVRFADALTRAVERGVQVRVLVDGVGDLYWFPRASSMLRRRGVPVARFLPPTLIPPAVHFNLRNHRKILVADDTVAFTGGMNVGDRHLAENTDNPARVVDMHFRLSGPVVAQIQQVFAEDWRFVTGEQLPELSPPAAEAGGAICRTIVEGPDEDVDKLPMILVGAVSAARERIWIMTPYFLPPRELIAALQAAALRGVEVNVILPARNNLRFVQWATCNVLDELIATGVQVYYQPPPFVHTKLFLVDDHYAQVGSANLDARSLRLNFELVTEIYDKPFAARLAVHFERVRGLSEQLSLGRLQQRPFLQRVRDAMAWLFSPYL